MENSMKKLDEYFEEVLIPDEVKTRDIQSVKEWLSKQPHLPQLTDRQIALFLYSSYGALELTKTTIDKYFTIRTQAPDIFDKRTLKEIKETTEIVYCIKLNKLSADGSRVVLYSIRNKDPEKYNALQFIRELTYITDLIYYKYPFSEGVRLVYDMSGFSFGHMARATTSLSLLKKSFVYFEEGIPMRLKGVHIFNVTPFVNQLMSLIKTVTRNDLFHLLQLHSDISSLYEYIPQEILPADLGGSEPTIEELIETSFEDMKKYEQWFVDDEKFGRVDERKRRSISSNSSDKFGTDGSFKRLDFD